jgi:hypothetical protein
MKDVTQTDILYATPGRKMFPFSYDINVKNLVEGSKQRRKVLELKGRMKMGQMQPKVTSIGEVQKIVDGLCGTSNKGGQSKPPMVEKPEPMKKEK